MPSHSRTPPFAATPPRRQSQPATPSRRRMRAFRTMDQEQMVQERTALLGCFLGTPQAVASALREARKAAMGQRLHYDPSRHAALVRLARASGPLSAGGGGKLQR